MRKTGEGQISLENLQEILSYDENTGIFTRNRKTGKFLKGSVAGSNHGAGYIEIGITRELRFLAHRLAWFYFHGVWPSAVIDHINGNKKDNRICNLRDVPHYVNIHNLQKPISRNTSGSTGVCWNKEREVWHVNISINGRKKYLGAFNSKEKASDAYAIEKNKLMQSINFPSAQVDVNGKTPGAYP